MSASRRAIAAETHGSTCLLGCHAYKSIYETVALRIRYSKRARHTLYIQTKVSPSTARPHVGPDFWQSLSPHELSPPRRKCPEYFPARWAII
jgi:hypothetical protein